MFFRRRFPAPPSFQQRLARLRQAGFLTEPLAEGRVQVSRQGCAAILEDGPRILQAGWVLGGQLAQLVDVGFQKFWQAPDGQRAPALAAHLQELHAFEEDLREALGLVSRYNTSLGTTNDLHLYDRLRPLGR